MASNPNRREIYPRGADEDTRVPEEGVAPASNDTEVKVNNAPDADLHTPAAAPADADAEAGAPAGSIKPLTARSGRK